MTQMDKHMLRMYVCCPQFIVSKPQVLFSAIVANLYTGVIVGVHVKTSIQNVCLVTLWGHYLVDVNSMGWKEHTKRRLKSERKEKVFIIDNC